MEPEHKLDDSENELLISLKAKIKKVITFIQDLTKCFAESKTLDPTSLAKEYKAICSNLESIIELIDESRLSSSYQYKAEYTDAGPGVGISNIEAKIWFVEMCRLERPDRQVRIHHAPGNSAQNEVERTNACIGDAMVDGGTLDREVYKAFDGMSTEDMNKLTLENIEEEEKSCKKKNAWHVAEQLARRIDDEPGPGGDFMIFNVSQSRGKRIYISLHQYVFFYLFLFFICF